VIAEPTLSSGLDTPSTVSSKPSLLVVSYTVSAPFSPRGTRTRMLVRACRRTIDGGVAVSRRAARDGRLRLGYSEGVSPRLDVTGFARLVLSERPVGGGRVAPVWLGLDGQPRRPAVDRGVRHVPVPRHGAQRAAPDLDVALVIGNRERISLLGDRGFCAPRSESRDQVTPLIASFATVPMLKPG
jgi:hypothetical protein